MPTLQYLSWSSFRFTSDDGVTIVIDPFLSGSGASGIPATPVPLDDIAASELMLVTHAAKDHFGQGVDLLQRNENLLLCASLDVRLLASEAGISEDRMVSMVPNSPYVYKDVTIIPTLSKHISSAVHADGNWIFGMPVSYFIKFAGGQCVFHAGDTAISLDLGLYGELYEPTVALLGIGGQKHPGRQPVVEMNPAEAARAARMLGVSVAIPCHFAPEEELENYFVESLDKYAFGVRPQILRAGETIDLTDSRCEQRN